MAPYCGRQAAAKSNSECVANAARGQVWNASHSAPCTLPQNQQGRKARSVLQTAKFSIRLLEHNTARVASLFTIKVGGKKHLRSSKMRLSNAGSITRIACKGIQSRLYYNRTGIYFVTPKIPKDRMPF